MKLLIYPCNDLAYRHFCLMSTLANSNTGASRQRNNNLRLPDEEEGNIEPKFSPNLMSAGAESRQSRQSRHSRLQELGETFRFQENKEELVKFWDQFTRKGKRRIGIVESLQAIIWSSCTIPGFLLCFIIIVISFYICRAEHISVVHPSCMGLQFLELE